MKAVWIIAWNDLSVFLKDRLGYVWLFAMPLVFMYFFGVSMRGNDGEPADPRPSITIENQDQGYLGGMFIDLLEAEGLRVAAPGEDKDPARRLQIPSDFTEKVAAAKQVNVALSQRPNSGVEPGAMIEVRITRAIVALTSAIFGLASDPEKPALDEPGLRRILGREKRVELDVRFAGQRSAPSGFEQSVPGYVVMFVLMNVLIFGGMSISGERANGVIRRVVVHPVSHGQLIVGKILGRYLLGIVQIVYLLLVGWLLFGMDYGGNLPLVGFTLLIFAWGCASLGVFIGAVIKGPEAVQGICTLVSVLMAALGGCWWPLEIVPDFARRIGHLFPTAWAMDALHQLISFGGGFAEIVNEIGLMTLFAVVSTWLATRFLRP